MRECSTPLTPFGPRSGKSTGIYFSFITQYILRKEQGFSSRFIAVVYMLFANIFITLINLLTKLNAQIPPYQLIYNRAFFEMLLSLAGVVCMREATIVTKDQETNRLLILRGLVGGLGLTIYYHAIYYLPISICVTFFNLTPLWIGVFTAVRHRKFEKWTFICMILSFAGMTLIIKPGFLDSDQANPDYNGFGFYLGASLAIATSVIIGFIFFWIKNLKGKIHVISIILYFNGFSMFFCAIGQNFEGVKASLGWKDYLVFFLLGFMSWLSQFLRCRALMIEKVFFVSVLMYMQIAMNYAVDIFVFDVRLDWLSNLGCVLIAGTMMGMVYLEQKG